MARQSPLDRYTFFGLNLLRFFSLIGLILVFASSIVVLVNDIRAIQRATSPQVITANTTSLLDDTSNDMVDCDYLEGSTVPNQPAGAFWAIVNRFLIIFEVILLFLSELSWPKRFFVNYFPVLGPDFGIGALGIFECLIGASVLSHHVATFPIVSAFFLFSVGCLNILFGLIFRESSRARRSITEWRDRVPDLPRTAADLRSGASSFVSAVPEKPAAAAVSPLRFDRGTGELKGGAASPASTGPRPFLISRPLETLPRYAPTRSPNGFQSGGQAI